MDGQNPAPVDNYRDSYETLGLFHGIAMGLPWDVSHLPTSAGFRNHPPYLNILLANITIKSNDIPMTYHH